MNHSELLNVLDITHLERWLRRRPPNESCGIRGASEECPVAVYLEEAIGLGRGQIYVNATRVTVTKPMNVTLATPVTLEHFIRLVDEGGERYSPVTAREALAYVQAVRS